MFSRFDVGPCTGVGPCAGIWAVRKGLGRAQGVPPTSVFVLRRVSEGSLLYLLALTSVRVQGVRACAGV